MGTLTNIGERLPLGKYIADYFESAQYEDKRGRARNGR